MSNVPTFQQFTRPLLELLAAEPRPIAARAAYEKLANLLHLDEDTRGQMLPSGKQRTYQNRIGWASSYLRAAGLVQTPARGDWAITDAGRLFLTHHAGAIDVRVLETIPAFSASRRTQSEHLDDVSAVPLASAGAQRTAVETATTPDEQLDLAHRSIVDAVAEELTRSVQNTTAEDFERLVIDLLGKMGYGASTESRLHVGQSGDGGIDGVISLDKLGFEKVYIQAKRWKPENKVGRPDVMAFFGALAGQRASKGLFITTSTFTKEAVSYAESVSGSLILVDGKRLVSLMIEYGLGVQIARTLAIPKIDHDYFEF